MPNRIIRESLIDSDRYNELPHDSERLLFIELLLLADDYGIVPLNHAFLRRRTTPCGGKTPEQTAAMLSALCDRDLVRAYQSERGGMFGYIPRFGNSPRAMKPKWPLPPDGQSLNEINALHEKRIADAKRLRTNAPETETETETEKSSSACLGLPLSAVPTKLEEKTLRASRSALSAPSDVSPQVWADFLKTRKALKAEVTETAIAGIRREAAKAKMSLEDALRMCCTRGWRGFKADWAQTSGPGISTDRKAAQKEAARAILFPNEVSHEAS
jgi:hypothetical protein